MSVEEKRFFLFFVGVLEFPPRLIESRIRAGGLSFLSNIKPFLTSLPHDRISHLR